MNELKISATASVASRVFTKQVGFVNLYHDGHNLIGGVCETLMEAESIRANASNGAIMSITRDTSGDFNFKIERAYG